jgi:hypothetical protein
MESELINHNGQNLQFLKKKTGPIIMGAHQIWTLRSCKGTSWTAWEFSKCQYLLLWLFIFLCNMNLVSSEKTQPMNQQIFWLPILEILCNTSFFCLGLEERGLAQIELCMGVVIEVLLCFWHSTLKTQEAQNTFWWLLLIEHQHHPIFLQLHHDYLFCPVLNLSIRNFSTILCTALLLNNVDAQFFCTVSVMLFLKQNNWKW